MKQVARRVDAIAMIPDGAVLKIGGLTGRIPRPGLRRDASARASAISLRLAMTRPV